MSAAYTTRVVDRLDLDGRTLVLARGQVLEVGPLAAVILAECAESPRDLAHLERAATAALGSPEGVDAGALVAAAVGVLVERGALSEEAA